MEKNDKTDNGFWLPFYEVPLTAFEMGLILGSITEDRETIIPGPDGKPIQSTLKNDLATRFNFSMKKEPIALGSLMK